ncbi:MAG TPA: hypothetical protein PKV72_02595 [Candidatus Peribacteria bacterium]|nr:hypothetical protein [Candidatus Peribacteria bacterium]
MIRPANTNRETPSDAGSGAVGERTIITAEQARKLVREEPFAKLFADLSSQREATTQNKLALTQQIYAELQRRFPHAEQREELTSLFSLLSRTHLEQSRRQEFSQWSSQPEGRQAVQKTSGGLKRFLTTPLRHPVKTTLVVVAGLAFLAARYWGWIANNMPVPNTAPGAAKVANQGVPPTKGFTVPDFNAIPKTLPRAKND